MAGPDPPREAVAEGRCLCGRVRYRVTGSLGEVRYCHCTRCRQTSGSAFSANARIPASRFALLAGREVVREYEHDPGVFRAFCAVCGSPLHARLDREPEHVRVRIGGLEGDLDVRITGHVWVSSGSSWYAIRDDLPRHPKAARGPGPGAGDPS